MKNNLIELAKLLRYYSLTSTFKAGSGHPSSSMSAADLMAALMFGRRSTEALAEAEGFFKFDIKNPEYPNNDRLIFSKGHASPLFYALWAVAGAFPKEELMTLRKFGSRLEGHPTMEFPFTEVPTGSLGQGLSVGVGAALNAKLDGLSYRTFVLLGDSEMAEGSVWEAMQLAVHYKLNNLVAILDVNRLGQRGETMYGHNVEIYQKKAEAFGWKTVVVDGHNFEEIDKAYQQIGQSANQPFMIIARTLKGKGVSFMEDKDGWHGKAPSADELKKALEELAPVDESMIGEVSKPAEIFNSQFLPSRGIFTTISNQNSILNFQFTNYEASKPVATRKAYGNALANIVEAIPNAVVLDAETSNSTYAEFVKKNHPEKFIECFIAEQNMVGMALGLSRRGKIPFVSTFAAFLSRAFDQIRMSQYARSNIKFCGSHAGVSIGEDGASQMGLEEIAMFRTLLNSVVLYPSDAVSTEKLVFEAAKHFGNVYIQTTRKETAILYANDKNDMIDKNEQELMQHEFKIGGSCVLKSSEKDVATVVAAGITVHEALSAYEDLKKEGINIRVVDLYSIKPLDVGTLQKCAKETGVVITVEDNFAAGGIGEAVAAALCDYSVHHILKSLSVRKMPHSGKPEELLAYEEIDKNAIIKVVHKFVSK